MLTPSLNTVMTRLLIGAAVLAALAFAVAFIAPAASAQDATIEYAENGDGPVRVFTSTDPEGEGIHWDVTGVDADDFTIDDRGELSFKDKNGPDYEAPTDRAHAARDLNGDGDTTDTGEYAATTGPDNTYRIIVRATEMRADGQEGRSLSTESNIAVTVTDVNEKGEITLSHRQPEVGTQITATLTDPDGTAGSDPDNPTTPTWQWYVSKVTNPNANVEDHWIKAAGTGNTGSTAAAYTPAGKRVPTGVGDDTTNEAGKSLRVVATYGDTTGTNRKAIAVAEFPVRAEVSTGADTNPANGSPGFSSDGDYTRTVSESIAVGSAVGDPVVATDPNEGAPNYDVLTYSLDDDNNPGNTLDTTGDLRFFRIDQATGQLYVTKALSYEAEAPATYTGKKARPLTESTRSGSEPLTQAVRATIKK